MDSISILASTATLSPYFLDANRKHGSSKIANPPAAGALSSVSLCSSQAQFLASRSQPPRPTKSSSRNLPGNVRANAPLESTPGASQLGPAKKVPFLPAPKALATGAAEGGHGNGALSADAGGSDSQKHEARSIASEEAREGGLMGMEWEHEVMMLRVGPSDGDLAQVEAFCRIFRQVELVDAKLRESSSPSSVALMAEMREMRDISRRLLGIVNYYRVPIFSGATGDVTKESVNGASASQTSSMASRSGNNSERDELLQPLSAPRTELPGTGPSSVNVYSQAFLQLLPSTTLMKLRTDVLPACMELKGQLFGLSGEEQWDTGEKWFSELETLLDELANLCADAGFARPPGYPSPAQIPNFFPVFQGSPEFQAPQDPGPVEIPGPEIEPAFWRGGMPSPSGRQWLQQQGFKTVVELVPCQHCENDNILSSQEGGESSVWGAWLEASTVEVVRIPIPFGRLPTASQVESFASLVEQESKRPLLLHSRQGIGSVSAMVWKWRNFVANSEEVAQAGAPSTSGTSDILEGDGEGTAGTPPAQSAKQVPGVSKKLLGKTDAEGEYREREERSILPVKAAEVPSSERRNKSEGSTGREQKPGQSKHEVMYQGEDSSGWIIKNALEAQRPVLRRKKGLGGFGFNSPTDLRGPPRSFREPLQNKPGAEGPVREADVLDSLSGPAGRWGLAEPGIPRAGRNAYVEGGALGEVVDGLGKKAKDASPGLGGWALDVEGTKGAAGKKNRALTAPYPPPYLTEADCDSDTESSSDATMAEALSPQLETDLEPDSSEIRSLESLVETRPRPLEEVSPISVEEEPSSGSDSEEDQGFMGARTWGGSAGSKSPETPDAAVGGEENPSMCASTTGVVRVQSRQKAEMFLVRTDGFSCTRERVKESTLAFTHPSTQQQMLLWKTRPKTVLLLKKLGRELLQEAMKVTMHLHKVEQMNVVVEPELHDLFSHLPGFGFVQTYYSQDTSELHERVDFVVCLGGDGVILHASNLFSKAVPPIVSFNLGSLGFLTAHLFRNFKDDLRAVIRGNRTLDDGTTSGIYITLRMRLRCELYRQGRPVPGKVFDVLNEVVVDRGSNPYLSKIECYERNHLITKVQADGVIVATPTGSTAYSTAAGGSMVHPNVPCMLFTPICPHSLSFRPIILPDSAHLELRVPEDARSNCWVSFDGKKRQQLSRGDSIRIQMSEHPMPTVNKSDQTDDWFGSLVRCLNWNERLEQKALPKY